MTWNLVEIWPSTYRRNIDFQSTSIQCGTPVGCTCRDLAVLESWNIQNLSILHSDRYSEFSDKPGIFRNLTYLKWDTYPEFFQRSKMECFAKRVINYNYFSWPISQSVPINLYSDLDVSIISYIFRTQGGLFTSHYLVLTSHQLLVTSYYLQVNSY